MKAKTTMILRCRTLGSEPLESFDVNGRLSEAHRRRSAEILPRSGVTSEMDYWGRGLPLVSGANQMTIMPRR